MSAHDDDPIEAYHASKPKPPASLLEAFANTAKALQQFGLERVRVVGLSKGCDSRPADGFDPIDGTRVVTEHEFMRDFVFLSRPCIILDAIEDWPAMQAWRDDRYVFDLDGRLPHVEQRDPDDDDDDEEEEEEEEEEDTKEEKEKKETQHTETVTTPSPAVWGPPRFTIALTPNGRADAVTHVLYDTRDVPAEDRADVYEGPSARKAAVVLESHPALASSVVAAVDRPFLRIEKIFMYAAEVRITLPQLYTLLRRGPTAVPPAPTFIDMRSYTRRSAAGAAATPVIAYAQLQNNCLNTEFTHVHADIRTNVEEFGTRVFGEKPEAANVWLGVPASVSSMHQDWVENLYPVVRGIKEFILIPPWEGVFVPKPDIPAAAFGLDNSSPDDDDDDAVAAPGPSPAAKAAAASYRFKPYPLKDGTVVPWMDLDITAELLEEGGAEAVLAALNDSIADNEARRKPIDPKLLALKGDANGGDTADAVQRNKRLREIHPLIAKVHPGETLYLPAMWLHRVAQHADEQDIRARARHLVQQRKRQQEGEQQLQMGGGKAALHGGDNSAEGEEEEDAAPLPLIAAVNYWYNMNFVNPSVVMLREFGLLL